MLYHSPPAVSLMLASSSPDVKIPLFGNVGFHIGAAVFGSLFVSVYIVLANLCTVTNIIRHIVYNWNMPNKPTHLISLVVISCMTHKHQVIKMQNARPIHNLPWSWKVWFGTSPDMFVHNRAERCVWVGGGKYLILTNRIMWGFNFPCGSLKSATILQEMMPSFLSWNANICYDALKLLHPVLGFNGTSKNPSLRPARTYELSGTNFLDVCYIWILIQFLLAENPTCETEIRLNILFTPTLLKLVVTSWSSPYITWTRLNTHSFRP